MKLLLPFLAIAVVAAQPIFGWTAIPESVNYNMGIAVALGVFDGLLIGGSILFALH